MQSPWLEMLRVKLGYTRNRLSVFERANMDLALFNGLHAIKVQLADLLEKHGRLPARESGLPDEDASLRKSRSIGPALPHPNLVRAIIRNRELRGRFFAQELFADPAWDMLLDLAASEAEHRRISVTSLCIASNVPPTTALRWIDVLVDAGLVARERDPVDGRRTFVVLTGLGLTSIAGYFSALEGLAPFLV